MQSTPPAADDAPVRDIAELEEIFRRSEKPRERFRIGAEAEKFGFEAGSMAPLPYVGERSVVSIFERFEKLCFVGHTHVPGVFLEGPDFYSPDELDFKFELSDEKAIINVGSVGQPRDRDPRSASFRRALQRLAALLVARTADGSDLVRARASIDASFPASRWR